MLSVQAVRTEARAVVIRWRGPLPSDVLLEVVSQPARSGDAASELCALASPAWLGGGCLGVRFGSRLPASAGPDRG